METIIRAFGGTRSEAEGILVVEKATFNESPYQADEVRAMLTEGAQHAWLAVHRAGTIVGFVIAFQTCGLERRCWEIDLLAVHPQWRGKGLARRLIEAAAAHGPCHAGQARAVVATDNDASARAFRRAGFQPTPEVTQLLIYRPQGLASRPDTWPTVAIREESGVRGVTAKAPPQADGCCRREMCSHAKVLAAREETRTTGQAELIEVETLLYRGIWIESLTATSRPAREALVRASVDRAKALGLDEVGAMVPDRDWQLRETLVAAGFRSLGEFHWFTAQLPPPEPSPETG